MEMFTEFKNEEQMMQTEACFNMAMERVNKKFGEVAKNRMESFMVKLWNNLALSVTKMGYEAAKDYARNASFAL